MTPEHISLRREGDLKRLRKRLLGDLDAIVLKALRKEPDRRYHSVVSFAEDLERHLERRPILAREASVWERLTRFIVREPVVFTAISYALAVTGAGLRTVVAQTTEDVEAALRNPATRISLRSLFFFAYSLCLYTLGGSVYLARVTKAVPALSTPSGKRQRIGAMVGGAIWGVCITLTWRLGNAEGWWHSRIPGHADPLLLMSRAGTLIYFVLGATVMWVLTMTAHRFGRLGTGIGLALLGLGTALGERIAFGAIIPALEFAGSAVSFLSTAALTAAAGWLGLGVMRAIGAPSRQGLGEASNLPLSRMPDESSK